MTRPPDPSPAEQRPLPHRVDEERTYSGDMVLLVLFVAIAAVVGLLLFVHLQMDRSMENSLDDGTASSATALPSAE